MKVNNRKLRIVGAATGAFLTALIFNGCALIPHVPSHSAGPGSPTSSPSHSSGPDLSGLQQSVPVACVILRQALGEAGQAMPKTGIDPALAGKAAATAEQTFRAKIAGITNLGVHAIASKIDVHLVFLVASYNSLDHSGVASGITDLSADLSDIKSTCG